MVDWDLGLSLGPERIGAAVRIGGSASAHLVGAFPSVARAVNAAAGAAPEGAPRRRVFVYPHGIGAGELGDRLGEVGFVGAGRPETFRDTEVVAAMEGTRIILIDADRDVMSSSEGWTGAYDAGRLATQVAQAPFDTAVYLTGGPEGRDRYNVAARDYAPMLVERHALAALSLTLLDGGVVGDGAGSDRNHVRRDRRWWWPF